MSAKRWVIPVDELKLHADERGEGTPALVFLHYWGGSGRTWTQVIDLLADRFRCVAIDLRGWGRSDRSSRDYSLFTQASDVEKVIATLGLDEFVVIGHSMGGKIAQILASRRPAGLRGLVLVAPAPPTPLVVPDEQKRRMLDSYASPEGVAEALQVLTHRPLTDDERRQVTEDTIGGAYGAKLAWVTEGMALDITGQAAAIRTPVSIIVGSADQVEREAVLREILQSVLPQARFEVLEGVGHLSPLEAPASVAEAISDFLAC